MFLALFTLASPSGYYKGRPMATIREQLKYVPFVVPVILAGLGFGFAPAVTAGIIAVGFFALAVLCVIEDMRLACLGRRAQGVVVDHQSEEGCFFPVIEFQDSDGSTRREATRMGRGVSKPPVGSHVIVLYDATGKSRCEIDRFWRRSGLAIVLCALGLVFAVGAAYSR